MIPVPFFGPIALLVVGLAFCTPLLAEVIFERQLPEGVQQKYSMNDVRTVCFSKDKTREDAVKEVKALDMGAANRADILKIEVLLDPKQGNRPYTRVTRLGDTKNVAAWKQDAVKRLAVGHAFGDYKYFGASTSVNAFSILVFDPEDLVGVVSEYYTSPYGNMDADIYEAPEKKIDLHQMLRGVIGFKCTPRNTPYGWVVEARPTRPMPGLVDLNAAEATTAPQKKPAVVALLWLSGDHIFVWIGAKEDDVNAFLDIYAKAFPSSLPADLKIDKAAWGQEEAEICLKNLADVIHAGGDAEQRNRRVSRFLYLMSHTIDIPDVSHSVLVGSANAEEQKAEYQRIRAWWDANKTKASWDEARQRLVVH